MSAPRKMRKVFRAIGGLLRVIVQLALLSVDLLFLLYDLVMVNFLKTGILRGDCRGRTAHDGHCRPARKYTNRWLFHLVCADVHFPRQTPMPICKARRKLKIHFLRGLCGLLLILAVLCAALVGMALI